MNEKQVKGSIETLTYLLTCATDKVTEAHCKVAIDALKLQLPVRPKHKQGDPVWGYCPTCGETTYQSSSPVGCKKCLQKLKWD